MSDDSKLVEALDREIERVTNGAGQALTPVQLPLEIAAAIRASLSAHPAGDVALLRDIAASARGSGPYARDRDADTLAMIERVVNARLSATPAAPTDAGALHILFDGPPGPEAGRFVEVETPDGRSVNAGTWHERPDGYWELRILTALRASTGTPAEGEDV